MKRISLALSSIVLITACVDTTEPTATRTDSSVVPNPIVMVGDSAAGTIAANELKSDGLPVAIDFNGRAAGITTFCSGNADFLALPPGQGFSSTERKRCHDLGGGWSAFSTYKGIVTYVKHLFAADLLEKGVKTFAIAPPS